MVKVREEEAMAEPKPSTASAGSTASNHGTSSTNASSRKSRFHYPSHYHHHHQSYHYCTLPPAPEPVDANGTGSATPARFYFGPGFERQRAPSYNAGPSQGQNGPEYIVLFHVNPGVTITFQMGDSLEILRGPVTVPMVSTNSSPPIAMPVQVPPGHVVQQIVDESGTLRHVILSPQHPGSIMTINTHNPPHYTTGPPNGTNPPPQGYHYPQGLPPGYHSAHHPHYPSNLPPGGHPLPAHPPGHSPPPSYYKDERTQRQYFKLKKKLHDKHQKGVEGVGSRKDLVNGIRRGKEKGMNSVGTSEDGEESSSVQDEEDSVHIITEMLSSVQAPVVSELSSRSALLQWAPPLRFTEVSSSDSHEPSEISENDLRYEVLLSDKSKEMKYKSIYSGTSVSCRIQDLRPGVEYSVCLQVHLDELQGSASEPVKFTTPACEPDQPQSPKLISRTKNSLQLRWNATPSNGSHILHYILEFDDGNGGEFVELHRSKGHQHTLQKLTPATIYKFRLVAVNEIGKSVYSNIVDFSTADNPPLQPNPPQLEKAMINAVQLIWEKRPKDDEFTLQMDDSKYGFQVIYYGQDNVYMCKDLQRYTNYKFKVKAQNGGGSSPWSEEVTFQTLPDRPARPSKPVVKGRIHAHSFRLKWEPPSDTGGAEISKYYLEVNSGSGYDMIYIGIETEAVCDKLSPGTTYQLRVSCESIGGRSNYSDPCTVTTEAISPGQCPLPRLHGKAKATSVVLRLTEPDYNGGAPLSEYEMEMISPDNSRSLVHKSKDTECTVNNLQPGCEYTFTVRAVNRIGPGQWSEELTVTSGAAPPETPMPPLATCRSAFNISIEWQEPPNNGATITEYRLEMSQVDNAEQFFTIHQGASKSFDVKGLIPFTPYYFRVQACNSAGYGPHSPISATITPAAPPSTIQTPKCEISPTSITLYWHEPTCNGSPILYYFIEIGDRVINTEMPVTEYTIESLQPETLYKIKMQAVNEVGTSTHSSTVRVTTLRLPPIPPKLECTGTGHNFIKLKWGEGKNQDYTQYCVEVFNLRSHEYQCVYKGTAFACKVNKLQEVTKYRFRICASNDAGEGDYSDDFEFETNIAPPAALKAPKVVEIEQRSCVLEWLPSRSAISDPILYAVQVSRLRDQQYKQVYKGSDTRCTLENLEAGAEYCARVFPIRLSQSGDLNGPYSPHVTFSTLAHEPVVSAKLSSTYASTPAHAQKSRSLLQLSWPQKNFMTETTKGVLISIGVVMVGLCVAFLLWVLNYK